MTGAVLRDQAGNFEGGKEGKAKWYPYDLDSLLMETMAGRDGVALVEEMGVQRVQVETDSKKPVKLWEAVNI